MSEAAHERFNARVNEHFEGTRDYIVTHYKTNSRSDTEYWRANAANRNLSEPLKQLLNLWMSGNSIAPKVRQQVLGRGYPVFSWYSIMAGMGIFPDPGALRAPTEKEGAYRIAEIDNLLERSAANYRDHREVLANGFHRGARVSPCRSTSGEGVFRARRRRDTARGAGRQAAGDIAWLGEGLACRYATSLIRRAPSCAISRSTTTARRSMRS